MKHFHIGLDFGTYQSKACILHVADDQHEFFRFQPSNSFFLPSSVIKLPEGRFQYGIENKTEGAESYHSFKISAAEDEAFHTETIEKERGDHSFYRLNAFHDYSPDFLSTVYQTYMLYSVKDQCREINKSHNPG